MTQKFFLRIDAESPDGEAVRCETKIKAECSSEMIIGVFANFIKQDPNMKKLIAEALLLSLDEDAISIEKISDEEYDKRSGETTTDLEF